MKKIGYLFFGITFFFSCAQIVAPTGGEKDSIPPSLISTSPDNGTKNFKGNQIVLLFDELIDASSLRNELLVVPELEGGYETKIKNNQVTLKLNNALNDSTTYTFNFRNGIKDLTEKNPANNLKLVLSTGDHIDSLNVSGKVTDIFTKNELLNITVGLFPNDTLEITKKKPMYFVKTDSSGNYKLENIKSGKYFVLAFNDNNNNLRLDQKEEWYGFLKDSLVLDRNIENKTIEIYPANRVHNKSKRVISRENEFVLNLEKTPLKVETDVNFPNLIESNKLTFFKVGTSLIDTTVAKIILTDSLLTQDTLTQKIYFSTNSKSKKRKLEPINISSNISNNKEITSDINYVLKFNKPIVRFDESSIKFKTDTLETEKLSFKKVNDFEYNLSVKTKAKENVELIIPSNSIENYLGDTNSVWSLKNQVLNEEELGLLQGETIEKTSPKIAQLIDSFTEKIIASQKFVDNFKFIHIIPGTYIIQIIFDTNENGIWDPGNLNTLEMPEEIRSTKTPIRVRANFEINNIIID